MHAIKCIVLALILGYTYAGFSQEIKVVDFFTNDPIPNAHICTESDNGSEQHFWVTNENGVYLNKLKNKSKVVVSFIGYQSIIDSLNPNQAIKFKLKPSTENLTEVVITGQFKPETKDKSIYNVQVINKMDIKNKAANNLADLLSNELNIKVENNGILGSSISMQGLSGEHIKILIDGVPVIGRQNGNIDLNQLNLQNVDHIEIIEGPMSVIYGSNALAGAINIITKKNTRPKLHTGVNTYFESVGVFNTDAFLTKNFNKHFVSITGGRNFFNGFFPNGMRSSDNIENVITDNFDPKEQYFGTLDYGYKNKKASFNINNAVFLEEIRDYGPVTYLESAYNDSLRLNYPIARDAYHYTFRTNTKGEFNYAVNEKNLVSVIAAYSYYNKTKNTKLNDLYLSESILIPDTTLNDTAEFNAFTSRGIYTKLINSFELQGGYDLNIETATGKRITNTKQINDYAAFVNIKYSISPKLTLQGGGRFIHNSKYNAPIVYSINIKYDPLEKLNFRASYGTGFRSPSLKELYLNFVDLNHNIKGNPNLKAEYSKSFNLSGSYAFGSHTHISNVSFKLYHTRLNNKIDFVYGADPTKADYDNIEGIYKTIGGQLDFQYNFHPRLKLTTGFNHYGNSKLSDLNKYTFNTDYIANLNYSNVKYRFKVNIYYKYNGAQHQFVNTGTADLPEIEEYYSDNYQIMDFSVSMPFWNEKVTISTGIKNLLDVVSIESTGSGGAHTGGSGGNRTMSWGRTYFLKLNYNFTKF